MRKENLEWEGVSVSLTSATIATTFEPETGVSNNNINNNNINNNR